MIRILTLNIVFANIFLQKISLYLFEVYCNLTYESKSKKGSYVSIYSINFQKSKTETLFLFFPQQLKLCVNFPNGFLRPYGF